MSFSFLLAGTLQKNRSTKLRFLFYLDKSWLNCSEGIGR